MRRILDRARRLNRRPMCVQTCARSELRAKRRDENVPAKRADFYILNMDEKVLLCEK